MTVGWKIWMLVWKILIHVIKKYCIRSIALPPLGCGLGGLDWNTVRERIETKYEDLVDIDITVFEPKGTPDSENIIINRKVPSMTPGRAALVELVQRYLSGLLDPFITLLEIHKLMYFLQESGENLQLHYRKAPYGPYAENLRHVLHAVEGYSVTQTVATSQTNISSFFLERTRMLR